MSKSPIPIRNKHLDPFEVARRVALEYGVENGQNGAPGLAVLMGYSPGVLWNKLNGNETTHHKLTVADLIQICVHTGDYTPLHALNHALGHACFQLVDYSGVSDQALLEHLNRIGTEGGDFHRTLQIALDDKRFSRSDYERVRAEGFEWIGAIAEAVHRIEGMVDG